ncbi:GyrI-like domain-containing protein [Winogradskyella litorisediminis]|uniref:GyrI-like domain-containing protein n=1 Tax=Winogradskyella litorisediminis TaxID=1156618 RepID=A0ABW3NBK7_9FLAO
MSNSNQPRMKALKYILFLLLILFIGLAIYIAVQPNSFEVERSRTINAPSEVIYNNVIDFENWETWNSWKEENPDIKIMLPEKTEGIGGSYTWEEDGETGVMRTIDSKPFTSITQEMQFGDYPKSDVIWTFTPNGDGTTKVSWKISGSDLPFMFKAYLAFMGGMEKQIGPQYERSLELLDQQIQKDITAYNIKIDGITEYGGGFYMYKTTSANNANISQIMAKQYAEILSYMGSNNIQQAGMPFTIYEEMNAENGSILMSQAIPVANKVIVTGSSQVLCGFIPKTRALKTTLTGNYSNLQEAWSATMNYIAQNNLEQSELKPFEIYQNDPGEVANPANWITEIYVPIKE